MERCEAIHRTELAVLRFGIRQSEHAILARLLQRAMAEHRLHAEDVGAVFQHLHGEGAAQSVNRNLVLDARSLAQPLEQVEQPRARQRLAAACRREERTVGIEGGFLEFLLSFAALKILLQNLRRGRAEEEGAVFVAFAQHAAAAIGQIEVFGAQGGEFARTAACVEQHRAMMAVLRAGLAE